MTTIFKYFMFGKYGCLDTNARGCCMHVFLVCNYILEGKNVVVKFYHLYNCCFFDN